MVSFDCPYESMQWEARGKYFRELACLYQDLSVKRISVKPSYEARNFHLIETIIRNTVRKEKPCSQS